MPDRKTTPSKRPRGSYARFVCLGCLRRKIRCELPDEAETPPNYGELCLNPAPCYRCKRLGIECVVRHTILGRPGTHKAETTEAPKLKFEDEDGRVPHEIHTKSTLTTYRPLSEETAFVIRAIDTIRLEDAEHAFPRRLVVRAGHNQALDLSIKAIVTAYAFARGVAKVYLSDCYRALAPALTAIQVDISKSKDGPSDDVLASTALLAPLAGAVERHDIPTKLHIEGLAAILAGRSANHEVTDLAKDILDFYVCDSFIMASVRSTSFPFENIPRAYFESPPDGCRDSDRARLKALSTELFIRIPRLVGLVRSSRQQLLPETCLSDATKLLRSLLRLEDAQSETRLLQKVKAHGSKNSTDSPLLHDNLQFESVEDFEALIGYWQSRLSLFRLERRLQELKMSRESERGTTYAPDNSFYPQIRPTAPEDILHMSKNIVMCSGYLEHLRLRKRRRMLAHAMLVVWGTVMDMSNAPVFHEGGSEENSSYLRDRVNTALGTKTKLTNDDLDIAADVFVGGPSKGRYAELYS